MATASRMRPGAGGGPIQNAKAQPKQRQFYGKAAVVAQKHPAKKPGVGGDKRGPSKAFAKKK